MIVTWFWKLFSQAEYLLYVKAYKITFKQAWITKKSINQTSQSKFLWLDHSWVVSCKLRVASWFKSVSWMTYSMSWVLKFTSWTINCVSWYQNLRVELRVTSCFPNASCQNFHELLLKMWVGILASVSAIFRVWICKNCLLREREIEKDKEIG